MSMKRLWTIAYGILPLLFFLGSSDTLWAQRDRHIGVLLATEHPTDATQPNVLALMTDFRTIYLRDKKGSFIPNQPSLSLSGHPVQVDSVYSMRIIPIEGMENAYEYKGIEERYRGYPFVRLQGYFFSRKMGTDPSGMPIPGLIPMFKTNGDEYHIKSFDPSYDPSCLGGILQDYYIGEDLEPIATFDVLFIEYAEKDLIPYRLLALSPVANSSISLSDEYSFADKGQGSCVIKTTSSAWEIFVFNMSGQLLCHRSITDLGATIQDLPRWEPLFFLIKVPYHTYTFKTLLR